MPGHHLQLAQCALCSDRLSSFQASAGMVSANIEGWAHYTEQMMLDQGYGDGDLALNARFVGADGNSIGMTSTGKETADAAIPETARLLIDVSGGRAPYTKGANFDGADHAGAVHDQDFWHCISPWLDHGFYSILAPAAAATSRHLRVSERM